MKITEKDRLDLRQELERVFTNPRLAEIAMEAMPPIDYSRLATKDDLSSQIALLNGELQLKMANQLRVILMMQVTTMLAAVGVIAAMV